jgi:hypothetical protein
VIKPTKHAEVGVGTLPLDPADEVEVTGLLYLLEVVREAASRGFYFGTARGVGIVSRAPQQDGSSIRDLGRHDVAGNRHTRRTVIRAAVLLPPQQHVAGREPHDSGEELALLAQE